jgi:hypothetical protein
MKNLIFILTVATLVMSCEPQQSNEFAIPNPDGMLISMDTTEKVVTINYDFIDNQYTTQVLVYEYSCYGLSTRLDSTTLIRKYKIVDYK